MSKRFLTLFLSLTAMCTSTMAQFITEENFPDPKFRSFLIENIDGIKGDRFLSESEKNAVTELNVSNQGIKDLTGIEYFTNLESIYCYGNEISGVNMYKLVNLLPAPSSVLGGLIIKYDGCSPDNVITKAQAEIAASKGWLVVRCFNDEDFELYDGEDLTVTDKFFPDATFRSIVAAYDTNGDNILSDTELGKVYEINVASKGITDLTGIEHFMAMTTLYCNNNELAALNVWNNKYLEMLNCSNNELTALDLSNNQDLVSLSCYGNNISGKAMDNLIYSLRSFKGTMDEGYLTVCSGQRSHDNTITTAQIKDAMYKDWRVWQYDGSDLTDMLIKVSIVFSDDANFQAYVASKIDKDGDGYLTLDERKDVRWLNVREKSIGNLSGIEYFTELRTLDCSNNKLTKLNVRANKKLSDLECNKNSLTSLDVSKNTELERLDCSNNNLESLDVSNNVALERISCSYNSLKSLDVSNKAALTYLYCDHNSLESLDVSNNTALEELWCPSNSLESLDVSSNTALRLLDCTVNSLKSLNVSKNTALSILWCEKNNLTSLDVSKNTALTSLDCFGNQIKGAAMDNLVNGLPNTGGTLCVCQKDAATDNVITASQVRVATGKGWKVERYEYNGSAWDAVDYAGIFEPVAIDATNFPDKAFRNVISSKDYNTTQDDVLSENELEAVKNLYAYDCGIKDLKGIEYFASLEKLCIGHNSLKSVDLSNNTLLKELEINDNSLESLDLSNNNNLTSLMCYNNRLDQLDLSKNIELTFLSCSYNQLKSLNLDRNNKLIKLYCNDNQLESLDLSRNNKLKVLRFQGNNIDFLNMDMLVNSLPKVSTHDGELVVCYYGSDGIGDNYMTSVQVQMARNEGWKVYQYYKGDLVDFTGIALNVAINEQNFPDAGFRKYLLQRDYGKDEILSEAELRSVTEMNVNGYNCNNLTGIEHFIWLEKLLCAECRMTNLDLSKNLTLNYVDCSQNRLTSLLFSPNPLSDLEYVACYGNRLKGDAMTAMVNSLPENRRGKILVRCSKETVDNVITEEQVDIADDKGWDVGFRYYDGDGFNYEDDWGYDGVHAIVDINDDYCFTEEDIELMIGIIMGTTPKNINIYAADLNNDGVVNAVDLVIMLDYKKKNGFYVYD